MELIEAVRESLRRKGFDVPSDCDEQQTMRLVEAALAGWLPTEVALSLSEVGAVYEMRLNEHPTHATVQILRTRTRGDGGKRVLATLKRGDEL